MLALQRKPPQLVNITETFLATNTGASGRIRTDGLRFTNLLVRVPYNGFTFKIELSYH
jgi:hypothetical protein